MQQAAGREGSYTSFMTRTAEGIKRVEMQKTDFSVSGEELHKWIKGYINTNL